MRIVSEVLIYPVFPLSSSLLGASSAHLPAKTRRNDSTQTAVRFPAKGKPQCQHAHSHSASSSFIWWLSSWLHSQTSNVMEAHSPPSSSKGKKGYRFDPLPWCGMWRKDQAFQSCLTFYQASQFPYLFFGSNSNYPAKLLWGLRHRR